MLVPIFYDLCKILNWPCLLCHILRHKNINYAKFCNSNLQLPAYTAHRNLQKITNQALKSTSFPRILWEAKCYSDALAETNVETWIHLNICCKLVLKLSLKMWERVHNLPWWFMIIARFSTFFLNSTFLIVQSEQGEKQGKIWWLVRQWSGEGVRWRE